MQAKYEILKRQKKLIETLNTDKEFAEFVMKQPGMEKFFIKACDQKYYGTFFFYEVYFNDIDNIWLICQACNLHKGNQDTLAWLKNQWLYGNEFLDYIAKKSQNPDFEHTGILTKIASENDSKGVAQVAIDWFWSRHANYISIQKKLLEEITVPIQILGQKIDRVIGDDSMKRAARLNASLVFKMQLMAAILKAKIDMPRMESESENSSSLEENYTQKSYPTVEAYEARQPRALEHVIEHLEAFMEADDFTVESKRLATNPKN